MQHRPKTQARANASMRMRIPRAMGAMKIIFPTISFDLARHPFKKMK
jgi:hypothetical protein